VTGGKVLGYLLLFVGVVLVDVVYVLEMFFFFIFQLAVMYLLAIGFLELVVIT
jgi:hypothetical protein